MALDDDIRILSGVRLFESFTQEQLRLLAFGAETVRLSRDRKLYREDDGADTAYVVVSGSISLFREQDGQTIAMGTAGPGSMLGELALIVDTRRCPMLRSSFSTMSGLQRVEMTGRFRPGAFAAIAAGVSPVPGPEASTP